MAVSLRSTPWLGTFSQRTTRRLTWGKGSGLMSSASTMLKMAELAPIPNANVITATSVKPGRLPSMRNPYRKSCSRVCISILQEGLFVAQRHHRIDLRCASRRDVASHQRHDGQQQGNHREGQRVRRAQPE